VGRSALKYIFALPLVRQLLGRQNQRYLAVCGSGKWRINCPQMKKIHIILLVLIIGSIVGMSFFVKDLTTQETFASAHKKDGKSVMIKAKLDKSVPIEYDAIKNPNLTVFFALDEKGNRSKVVYNKAKITDMERSESLNLNGVMRDGYFECATIQTKCPSKYKDDPKYAEKNLPTASTTK
jgi:cytochrome c-type biogenesis protein CcmE